MLNRRCGVVAAVAVVWFVWGSTYVAIRVGLRSLPPFLLAGVRFEVAGLVLYGWCWWRRRRHPEAGWRRATWREWRAGAILGLLLPAAGTGGVTWAEQELPAGVAALLLASIPVWLILACHIAGIERITRRASAGLVLGLAGVAVLANPLSGGAPSVLGSAVALGGAFCWGCGSAYAMRAPRPGQPLLGSSMQLICGGIAMLAAGVSSGELSRVTASALASESALALGYLIVFGSLVAYSAYDWLVRTTSSTLTGTDAFVNPVVAVLLGWALLGEHITGRTLLAAAIIVTGVILMVVPARKREEAADSPKPAWSGRPALQVRPRGQPGWADVEETVGGKMPPHGRDQCAELAACPVGRLAQIEQEPLRVALGDPVQPVPDPGTSAVVEPAADDDGRDARRPVDGDGQCWQLWHRAHPLPSSSEAKSRADEQGRREAGQDSWPRLVRQPLYLEATAVGGRGPGPFGAFGPNCGW
jgi:drug/metabolite transporter (DMT)-like permease